MCYAGGARVGIVTSGTQTPYLKKSIGMAYVPAEHGGAGHRDRRSTFAAGARARVVVPLPFYKRTTEPEGASVMAYPAGFKYTKDHEWIDVAGDRGRVGITDYAQQQLGDVVYVELPEVGTDAEGRAVVRHDRVGQGGVRALLAGVGRSRRGERRAEEQARSGQHRPSRQLDDRAQADERRRNRRRCSTPRSTPVS